MGTMEARLLDIGAFDARYPELLADLSRICRAVGAGPDAEDVAQDALIYARGHLRDLRDDTRLVPWLRRIAVRGAVRRRSRGAGPRAESFPIGMDFAMVELNLDERHAIHRLTERQRQLIAIVYLAGYRQDEAAEMLGISRGTVAKTLWLARRALAHSLADYRKEQK